MATLPASKQTTYMVRHAISMFSNQATPATCNIYYDEKNSGRLDAYHTLAERLLATGDWIASHNQAKPPFSATSHRYDLVLLRHFFKDGKLTELSIKLLLDTTHQNIEYLGVFSSDSKLNERLSLDEAVADIDAFIAKIDAMFVGFAAETGSQCWDIKLTEEIPFDEEVLMQHLLSKFKHKGEKVTSRRYKNIRIEHFVEGLLMVVSFTNGNKEYMHSFSINNYLKAVFYARLDEMNKVLGTVR